jgi:hypothetical protein
MATALFAHVGLHLLALGLLAATAWVAGGLLLPRRLLEPGLERFAVAVTLGLIGLSSAFLLLGLCGQLRRGPLLALTVGVHLLGLPVWREALGFLRSRIRSRRSVLPVLGAAVALAPVFWLALYPPTAFDETLYHLPFVRAFARSGGVPLLPHLRNPVFPQLQEVLCVPLLLFFGDVATHLLSFLETAATAALLLGWGRRFSSAAGWIAVGAFLGNPIVAHLAGTDYVEPGQALFAAAAVYALERWRESGLRGWLVLAGAFAGGVAGTKYFGLFFVGAVALAALLLAPDGRRWRALLIAAASSLVVLGPWYARILVWTGSPLFPFYPEIFGASPWAFSAPPRPWAARLADWISLPWNAIADRAKTGMQPPWSPVDLLALPLLAWVALRERRVRLPLAVAGGYFVVFLVLPPDARYLSIVLPLVSLALGLAVARIVPEGRTATVVLILALLCFLPGWLYAGWRIGRAGPLPVTLAAREAFLAQKFPAYRALRWLDRERGRGFVAYGFYIENMVYFADGTLLGDWSTPARFSGVEPFLRDPERLRARLRELGAQYVVVTSERGPALPDTPPWRRCFRPVYADGQARVLEILPDVSVPAPGGT